MYILKVVESPLRQEAKFIPSKISKLIFWIIFHLKLLYPKKYFFQAKAWFDGTIQLKDFCWEGIEEKKNPFLARDYWYLIALLFTVLLKQTIFKLKVVSCFCLSFLLHKNQPSLYHEFYYFMREKISFSCWIISYMKVGIFVYLSYGYIIYSFTSSEST